MFSLLYPSLRPRRRPPPSTDRLAASQMNCEIALVPTKRRWWRHAYPTPLLLLNACFSSMPLIFRRSLWAVLCQPRLTIREISCFEDTPETTCGQQQPKIVGGVPQSNRQTSRKATISSESATRACETNHAPHEHCESPQMTRASVCIIPAEEKEATFG